MARSSMAALFACLPLGLLIPGVVGAETGPRRGVAAASSALSEDDACHAEGSTSSTCAVSALQHRSHRGLADNALAKSIAKVDSSDNLWYRLQSASYKEFPAELPPGTDTDWVWPRDVAYYQLHANNDFVENFVDVYDFATPNVLGECNRFVTYFWPMYSFWMQESLRRIEATPEDAPPETTKKLQNFVRQASYLNCVWFNDPRNGTEWSKHVTEHMQMVRDRPSTDLEFPELPEWFHDVPEFFMYVHDACIFWGETMTCNLGYIARDVTGNKAGSDVCWDKVQVPTYGYSMFGISLIPGRLAVQEEPYNHTEYLECQEHPIAKTLLDDFCPFAGHYPDGLLNTSWGHGPAKGTKRYEDVLKCEAKLKMPEWSTTSNYPIHRAAEGNYVDVLKPSKGPLPSYDETQAQAENGSVIMAGWLAEFAAKLAARKAMNKTTFEDLKGLPKVAVDMAGETAKKAARAAAKALVNKTHYDLPIMPED